MTRPLDALGLAPEDLAAWRAASAATVAALAGTALTAEALLLLGAQCVASAGLALDDMALALDEAAAAAMAMRAAMDAPAHGPARILLLDEEDGDG